MRVCVKSPIADRNIVAADRDIAKADRDITQARRDIAEADRGIALGREMQTSGRLCLEEVNKERLDILTTQF